MFTIDFTKPFLYKDVIYFNQGNLAANNILRCKVITGGDASLEDYIGGVTFVTLSRKEINGVCNVVDTKNCIIDIHFPSNALEVGENTLEIILTKGSGSNKVVAQSPVIKYKVWQGITTGNGVQGDNNYPILIDLISSVNNVVRVANNASATANASLKQTAKMLEDVDNTLIKANNTINDTNNAKNKALEAVEDVKKAILAGTQDLEVKRARGKYLELKDRFDNLDKDLLKAKEMAAITITTENNLAVVEDTVDGYFEDIKLEGKTSVNIKPKNGYSLTYNYINYGSAGYVVYNNLDITKTYTCIVFEDTKDFMFGVYNNDGTSTIVKPYSSNNIMSFKPISSTAETRVYVRGGKDGLGEKTHKFMLLEGDCTQNPPPQFFEGMKSVGDDVEEIVVTSVKGDGNLCDIETDIINAYSYGEFKNDLTAKSVLIRCEPNTKYYVASTGKGDRNVITTYTTKPKQEDNANKISEDNFIITGANDNYLLYYVSSNISTYPIENVYIGKNSFEGDFKHESDEKKVLYYDTETQTWKKPVLREWDSIEEHSKYYYHKRTYLFDGKIEDLSGLTYDESQSTSEIKCYYIQRDEIKRVTNCEDVVICDKLKTLSNYSKASVGISTYTAYESANPGKNWIYFKLPIQYDTVEKAKNFIKTLNMVSLLAKEEVYECTPIDLITFEDETNYMIGCGSISPKTILKCQNYIGNVINTLKEKVSYLEDKIYNTNLANFTVALNTLDTKLKLEQLTKTPK